MRRKRHFVIYAWCITHVFFGQKNKYLLNFSHHVQQFFMDNLYNFKAGRKRGQSSIFSIHELYAAQHVIENWIDVFFLKGLKSDLLLDVTE